MILNQLPSPTTVYVNAVAGGDEYCLESLIRQEQGLKGQGRQFEWRRSKGRVIVGTPGWAWPWTSERQSYLLMPLPKLKASMNSSMKRMIMAIMGKATGWMLG